MEAKTSHWDEKRQQIYNWMVGNGQPAFAELYKGCTAILRDRPPGHVRFISHGVRELMNGMPAKTLGLDPKRVEYKNLVDKICELWNKHTLPKESEPLNLNAAGAVPSSQLNLLLNVAKQIQKLISEHESASRRTKKSTFLFFQAYMPKEDPSTLPSGYPQSSSDEQIQRRKEYFYVKQLFPFTPVLSRFGKDFGPVSAPSGDMFKADSR
jgi:hypothetical protein